MTTGADIQTTNLIEPYDITSERELERELVRLFQSAYRNEVPIGPTWVLQYEDRPDLEIVAHKLAENREDFQGEIID